MLNPKHCKKPKRGQYKNSQQQRFIYPFANVHILLHAIIYEDNKARVRGEQTESLLRKNDSLLNDI